MISSSRSLERRFGVRFQHACPCCGFIRRCTTGACPEPLMSDCPECAKLPPDQWLKMANVTKAKIAKALSG